MKDADIRKVTEGVIINTNIDDLTRYKMARKRAKKEKDLSERVSFLEQELNNLKRIVHELSNRVQ